MKKVFGRPILEALILWQDITSRLRKVRGRHFVYLLCNGDDVVYVGRTRNLADRLSQHKHNKQFNSIYLVEYPSYEKCKWHERMIAKHYRPIENRMWTLYGI